MSVTGIEVGIQPAGSAGSSPGGPADAGHLWLKLFDSSGIVTTLQAGPTNPGGSGSLVQQPGYVATDSGGVNVINMTAPAGVSIADVGQQILNSATLFNYNAEMGYSPTYAWLGDGMNSNTYVAGLLASAYSQDTINTDLLALQENSGLNLVGSDPSTVSQILPYMSEDLSGPRPDLCVTAIA